MVPIYQRAEAHVLKTLRLILKELNHRLRHFANTVPENEKNPNQNIFHGSILLLLNARNVSTVFLLKQDSPLRFIRQIIKIAKK